MQTRTAGDPDNEQVVFTDLTPTRMEQELAVLETPASDDLICQWMDEQKLRLRKIRKVLHLQAVVDSIGVEIRVAHYPSYCSK